VPAVAPSVANFRQTHPAADLRMRLQTAKSPKRQRARQVSLTRPPLFGQRWTSRRAQSGDARQLLHVHVQVQVQVQVWAPRHNLKGGDVIASPRCSGDRCLPWLGPMPVRLLSLTIISPSPVPFHHRASKPILPDCGGQPQPSTSVRCVCMPVILLPTTAACAPPSPHCTVANLR